jgi:DNA-binding IclR family transcriptional regulator
LIVLGGRAQRANSVRAVSRPELEKLASVTGDTATLELLVGREVVIIEEIPGDYLTSGKQEIGTRWPAHTTSTGKAILAYASADIVTAFLAEPLPALTERTMTDPILFERCLEEVRKKGYAVVNGELEQGYVAVGAPIFDVKGSVVAAVSIGGPGVRLTTRRINEIGTLVLEAAGKISRQLGYRDKSMEVRD